MAYIAYTSVPLSEAAPDARVQHLGDDLATRPGHVLLAVPSDAVPMAGLHLR